MADQTCSPVRAARARPGVTRQRINDAARRRCCKRFIRASLYNLAGALRAKVLGAEAAMIVRNAHVRLHVKLAVTCHQLRHTTGQEPVSKRIDSSVRGEVVDLTARHADVHQLPVAQVVQAGS